MSNRITEKLLFSPTNIPGCAVWLDAADTSSQVLSGANITQWNDKSGNNNNFTTTSGTITVGADSTYPNVVIFPNSLTYMTSASSVTFTTASSVFIVAKITNVVGGAAANMLFTGISINGQDYSIRYNSSGLFGGGTSTTDIGTSSTYFTTGNAGVTGSLATYQSYHIVDTVFSAGGTSQFTLSSPFLSNRYWYGTVAEVIVYTFAITTAQRQQVEGYLAWKWGLQANLPSTQPYKNLAPSYPFLNKVTITALPGFSPTSISGLTAWFDGSDPAGTGTPPSNGATISTWVDKSGSSHNAVAGVGPTFAAASLNGLGTLTFDGASTFLYASGLTVPTNTHSLFAVHNPVGTNANTQGGDTGILRAQETIGYIVFPYAYNGTQNGYTTSYISGYFGFGFQNDVAGSWNLYETVVGSSAVTQYQYGTVVTANTGLSITATTSDNFTVGSYSYFGGSQQQFYYGSMAELLVFNVELSTTDRQKIEGYLAWKWGKQASLDPSHPYYSAPPPGAGLPYSSISNKTSVKYFSPLTITGVQLWLDAADISTLFQNTAGTTPVTAAGQQVQFWKDKSGNARNATSSDTAMTYNRSGINYPSIYFTGSQATGFQVNVAVTDSTYFFVVNNASPNDVRVYNSHNGTSHLKQNWWYNTYRTQMDYSGISGLQGPSNTSGVTLVMTRQDTSSSGLLAGWQTGTSIGTVTAAVAIGETFTSFVLGTDNGSFPMIGYIAEAIVYNSVLSTSQRQQVEGYLAWKWGQQASLPSTHPWFNCPPPP